MSYNDHQIRTTIKLSDRDLDVFQMPDGGYSYGVEFFAKLIDRDKTILSDKKSPYYLRTLLGDDKTSQTVKVEGIGYNYKTFSRCQTDRIA